MSDSTEFKCNHCNKLYASYKSRWLHIKKYHQDDVVQCSSNVVLPCRNNVVQKDYPKKVYDNTICKYCEKKFCDRKYRWKHEKICIENPKNSLEPDTLELKNIISKQSEQIDELKELLLKSMKIHPKTLNKINKQLNNNGVINNTTNNIQIVQLGEENLNELLSKQEKIKILNHRAHSLKEIVNLVHISDKYTQFRNIYITNLQNSIGYKYDTKTNSFIAVNKSVLLDDIIDCRMCDIETFYNELEDKLDVTTTTAIKRFIDRMNDEDDKLKGVKKEELKLLLYNSREKITGKKDIEL